MIKSSLAVLKLVHRYLSSAPASHFLREQPDVYESIAPV